MKNIQNKSVNQMWLKWEEVILFCSIGSHSGVVSNELTLELMPECKFNLIGQVIGAFIPKNISQ